MNDPTRLALAPDEAPRGRPVTGGPAEPAAPAVAEPGGPAGTVRETAPLRGSRRTRTGPGSTLRAAAVGRPIEDVAVAAGILGPDEPEDAVTGPTEPAGRCGGGGAPRPVAAASVRPGRVVPSPPAPGDPDPGVQFREAGDPVPPAALGRPSARTPRTRRPVLRWPAALALLTCGVLHLPGGLTALPPETPEGFLPLVAAVSSLVLGVLPVVRDTVPVWRAGAVAAVGVVALHVVGGVAGFDPLEGSWTGAPAWAAAAAVLCAALAGVLAGLALVQPGSGRRAR